MTDIELKEKVKEKVYRNLDLRCEKTDEEIIDEIDEAVRELGEETFISFENRKKLSKEVFYALRRLDFLQDYIDDPGITEIMVNGPDDIFVERNGALFKADKRFDSREKLNDVVQQIVAYCNRVVNEGKPIADARLPDGSRVNIVLPPVALNGPIITIRRFPVNPFRIEDLIEMGSISPEAAEFLKKLVIAGYNIFISGGTGSGKTTFLNVLSKFIPESERIITIEDSAELQLYSVNNLVRLETRNANLEGCKEISIRDLIRASLRMRPDRIIVGEVRGEEAIDMIQALNTGHDGSMSTGHANSARDMIFRLETMVLMGMDIPIGAVRGQIASGLDIIVHLGRLRDRSRRILEIAEVMGMQSGEVVLETLYEFCEKGVDENGRILGDLEKRKNLTHTQKLRAAGL